MRTAGRRYHPSGTVVIARARRRGQRTAPDSDAVRMRGGNLVRSLTPRQAVVWLMHLEEVASKLPRSVAPQFTVEKRDRLARALRARVATREGLTRRRVR